MALLSTSMDNGEELWGRSRLIHESNTDNNHLSGHQWRLPIQHISMDCGIGEIQGFGLNDMFFVERSIGTEAPMAKN